MGEYEHLYALKGVTCQDIDGDGLKDIVILADYSWGKRRGTVVEEAIPFTISGPADFLKIRT